MLWTFVLSHWRLTVTLAVAVVLLAAVDYYKHEAKVWEADYINLMASTKAAGEEQERRTNETIAAQKAALEKANEKIADLDSKRGAAVADAQRLSGVLAGRRLVPAPAAGASGSSRVCYTRDELDRRLHASLATLFQRVVGLAEQGQRGVDVATSCRSYFESLPKGK